MDHAEKILFDQRNQAYAAGYRARAAFGKDRVANPYINVGREDLRNQWRAGWDAADAAKETPYAL